MRVGAIQSNYVPWRGYFDFIRSVDLFVFHDDVQYTKQDWRNRNKLKGPHGPEWVTVPVRHAPVCTTIDDIEVDGEAWRVDHERRMRAWLRGAPYLEDAIGLWKSARSRFLGEINRALTARICEYLGIRTPLLRSCELGLEGAKTERLVLLMQRVGGTVYLSGPAARNYLEVEKMTAAGFAVEWMRYGPYPEYPQRFEGFEPHVSVLDLIANTGPMATKHLTAWDTATS